jgi:hypothetical protein
MMLSADRLRALLEPQGFWMHDVDSVTKTIAFVRQSGISPLYEHLSVYGQGKKGEAVYAKNSISGSSSQSQDECVAEEDLGLIYALESDGDRHWTLVNTTTEANAWERKLAQVADSYCRATSDAMGPLLKERLHPAFLAVSRYIAKLGNIKNIFASEFRYFEEASEIHRDSAERLASLIGQAGGSWEDVQLACLVLFQFAAEVEGREAPFRDKRWHEDANLRARIYLLVDFICDHRKMYVASNA